MSPVPPPPTVRVPETEGVKVRAPEVGTIESPYVSPLTEPEVVVEKVKEFAVVVEYPEPKVVVAAEYKRPPVPIAKLPTESDER